MKEMETLEGQDFVIRCDHPTFNSAYSIQWYIALPGKGPLSIITAHKNIKSLDGKFTVSFSNDQKHSFLGIQNVKPEESAMYICVQASTEV
ncbi:hypothetical protein GDO78_013815 [Eleutherodactylus coqui]|uniref:Ig-like domain-containing protein n=1 Tax=Eleutherodactylus coqui TaxID=57060 RepID=A0A8J6JQU7_ELECQ|nr:hypothetical protein GDO78_013815 [Eleutherodactylus coqui]